MLLNTNNKIIFLKIVLTLCVGLFCILPKSSSAQTIKQFAYAVTFTDKPHVISHQTFLSAKSHLRRAKYNIPIDTLDYPINYHYVDSILKLTNGALHCTSRWLNHAVILVKDSNDILPVWPLTFVQDVKMIGSFTSVLHENNYSSDALPVSNNRPIWLPIRPPQFDNSFYGSAWVQTSIMNAQKFHELGYFGDGIQIAVLDNGFFGVDQHTGYDSLFFYERIHDIYNYNSAGNDVYTNGSHGSGCLSLMAGYLPGQYVGAAPKADFDLYVSEQNGSEQLIELYNLLSATERADSMGADIISVSLGYNIFFGYGQNNLTLAEMDGKTTVAAKAANIATQKGIVFVVSAGNEGQNMWH